jgi:peptide/nickel transport system permease protein
MSWWFWRIFRLLVCLIVVLSINFLLPRAMPGDPVRMLLGPDAVSLGAGEYDALRAEYGLDRPVWEQYTGYWKDLFQGDLGFSFHHHRPVTDLIREHLGRSLGLLVPALLLSTLAAGLLGTLAGWKAGSATDISLSFLSMVFFATPSFLTAMVFLDLFGYRLEWFSMGGYFPAIENNFFSMDSIGQFFHYLTLPIGVLALTSAGAKFLVMRNAVSQARHEEYVLYARAKGIAPWRVPFVHIFKSACLPLLNLVALHVGFMVSGAVLVEVVFSINGMGILIFDAALNRDYPLLQGCFLALTLVVMGLNLLVDLISGVIDPRVRYGWHT